MRYAIITPNREKAIEVMEFVKFTHQNRYEKLIMVNGEMKLLLEDGSVYIWVNPSEDKLIDMRFDYAIICKYNYNKELVDKINNILVNKNNKIIL